MPGPTGTAADVLLPDLLATSVERRDRRHENHRAIAERVVRANADLEAALRRARTALNDSRMLLAESRRRVAARRRK
jgi:hypothetical protein